MIPELTEAEARVLGCLLEKAATTPDHYPLSVNSLVAAANQTTNRDPIVRYDDAIVEEALASLREKRLATRGKGPGERAIKHKHRATETLELDPGSASVLGVLLLRGAQTPGELKVRTERWHSFADLEGVERVLNDLAARGLVVHYERRPGQKEARWATLLTPVGAMAPGPISPPPARVNAPTPPTSLTPADGSASVSAPEPTAPVMRSSPSLRILNPATGELIREVASDGDPEVAAKVARARAARAAWRARDYDDRALLLLGLRDLLDAEEDDFARTTTAETGKPITQARHEVRSARERIDWYVDNAAAALADRAVADDGTTEERVTYEPVGVVAHVSAWNYPYFVALNSIVPALLTGNVVLYKPSEYATLTGLAIIDALHRSGVPIDVVQAVVGNGATGAALVGSDDLDMVCFTGSYSTGTQIARAAAVRLTRVQLELGGKDAAYVTEDVDIEPTAAAVAEGAFYNAGQSCCAIERIYVNERIWEPFVAAFVAVTRSSWRVGDPTDPATTIGPLARPQQVTVLADQVADAERRKARVLLGGHAIERAGNWFEPTVIVDADHTMSVMREESFGPVIGLMRVSDDAHAIECIDDTPYGLTAAVFTRERSRAESILRVLDTGSVYWNCSDRTSVRLPWAGRRRSGLGVSMSDAGVRTFTPRESVAPPNEFVTARSSAIGRRSGARSGRRPTRRR